MMKKPILVFLLWPLALLSFHVSLVQAEDFSVYFETATTQIETDTIEFDGVRVEGFDLTKNDALKVRYVFNPATLNFEFDPESLVIYPAVGVFHEKCIVANVEPPQPSYQLADGQIVEGGSENGKFTTTLDAPFVATFDLQIGHVISLYFKTSSKALVYQVTGPNVDLEQIVPARDKEWKSPFPILKPGTYQVTVKPSNPEDTATFEFNALNLNHRLLQVLANRTKLRERFTHQGECAKFQVTLKKGEILNVPASKDENIVIKLIDQTSRVIIKADKGIALTYQETAESSDYYLFVYSTVAKGRYSGNVTIAVEKPAKPSKPSKPSKPTQESNPNSEEPSPEVEEPVVDEIPNTENEEIPTDDNLENSATDEIPASEEPNGEAANLTNSDDVPSTEEPNNNNEVDSLLTPVDETPTEANLASNEDEIDMDFDTFFADLGKELDKNQ